MFRLIFSDEKQELYRYLCQKASETIIEALNEETLLIDDFARRFKGEFGGFFDGIGVFLGVGFAESDMGRFIYWKKHSSYVDDQIGMEFVWRKYSRMKEKLADPEKYYTFDLLEELLFYWLVYEELEVDDEAPVWEDYPELIEPTRTELVEKFHVNPDFAPELAARVSFVSAMGPDESEYFFWDTDCVTIFRDGFIKGIEKAVCGMGCILGYGYEDICSIFTEIGVSAPLQLVGTKAAYETVNEVSQEKLRNMMMD